MRNKIENPKIFISYAWSSRQYEEKVLELASRLTADGIEVLIDKWIMEPGSDTVNFMEKCVKDPSVNFVLMLLDKVYMEKANNRIGGVGIETQIISTEVYNNIDQNKFIPIIFERSENGEIYVPVYLKSRYYYDFTDGNLEEQYMMLVKQIYGRETFVKPSIGKMPSWVDEDLKPSNPLKFKIINSQTSKGLLDELSNEIINHKFELIAGTLEEPAKSLKVLECYSESKNYRNCLLEIFLKYCNNDNFIDEVCDFYEKIKNWNHNNRELAAEIWDAFIHETFIYLISILYKNRNYKDLNILITKSYFFDGELISSNEYFYSHNYYTIDTCKDNVDKIHYNSSVAQLWIESIYEPKITKEDFVFADLLIYNLSILLINENWYWFPICYNYINAYNNAIRVFSVKLKSSYELKKFMPLFGVENVKEVKQLFFKMEEHTKSADLRYRYYNSFHYADLFLDFIKIDDIGSVN